MADEKKIKDEDVNESVKTDTDSNEESKESKKDDKQTKKKKKRFESKKKDNALKKEIAELEEKNAELKDKYIRLVAEYDNYRRRTAKEKIEMREMAASNIICDLLPLVDDFNRAIEFSKEGQDIDSVQEGMNLLYKKLEGFLKSKSVEEIDAMNQDFDTDFHEAITKIPAPSEKLKGKVVDVVQKGYKINDKVIRYSKVVVGE